MDEQTQQALSAFVQKALTATEQAGSFAVDQAPIVVQEYLTRAVFYGVRDGVFGTVLLVIAYRLFRRARAAWDGDYNDDGRAVALSLATGVTGLVGIVSAYSGFSLAISVYLAPRVYIIEQLKGLL